MGCWRISGEINPFGFVELQILASKPRCQARPSEQGFSGGALKNPTGYFDGDWLISASGQLIHSSGLGGTSVRIGYTFARLRA